MHPASIAAPYTHIDITEPPPTTTTLCRSAGSLAAYLKAHPPLHTPQHTNSPHTHAHKLYLQKCGTTSLAAYLKAHPDIDGIAGMPGHGAAPAWCV